MIMDLLVRHFIHLMERGYLPDCVIRMGIRMLLRNRILELNSHIDKKLYFEKYINSLKTSPLAIMTNKANEQHYEVPTEFYDLCLGLHKKYSSCYWGDEQVNLEHAEQYSLDLSIEHADIHDGMSVLELGCGWGSLSLELAKRFPNSKITSVSNSKTQKLYIDQKATERGLTNLEVLTLDLGKEESYSRFQLNHFDRVMSIEMMEHLRNYDLFFELVSHCMKADAKFFIHVFTHKSTPYYFESHGDDNWMGKYFFSGGQMPSVDLFENFDRNLVVRNKWIWNGRHYQKTLEAWLSKMDLNKTRIQDLFVNAYGSQNARLWFNRWRVFYMSCSELFGYSNGNEWHVTHYLLTKKDFNEK